MFVELLDQLRCPAPHEETWLVLFADESRDRHILRGTLGCPVCHMKYPIVDGTVWFTAIDRATHEGVVRALVSVPPAAVPLPPTALAAYLDLGEPGGAVALFGSWAGYAEELGDIIERVELVAIAPDGPTHPMQSAIMPPSRAQVPLAPGALRAAAVDAAPDAAPDAAIVVIEAARIVRSGGRILAPASAPVPAGVRELTRDDTWWIGEREGGTTSGMIPLGRSRSR